MSSHLQPGANRRMPLSYRRISLFHHRIPAVLYGLSQAVLCWPILNFPASILLFQPVLFQYLFRRVDFTDSKYDMLVIVASIIPSSQVEMLEVL